MDWHGVCVLSETAKHIFWSFNSLTSVQLEEMRPAMP
jgi:hypothetical protein